MREIKRIILHCTATRESQAVSVADIDQWHRSRGFKKIGYHYVIHPQGELSLGRPVADQGAHVKHENVDSIGVAYIGGLTDTGEVADTMTIHQDVTFLMLVRSLRMVFGNLTLHGHNEFSNKACPSFDVQEKYSFLL